MKEKTAPIYMILVLGILLSSMNVAGYAQQNQNIETKIEIKITGKINATPEAKLYDLLKYFESQNPRLKIHSRTVGEEHEKEEGRESKVEKYHFIPITIFALTIIFILWLFISFKKEKRRMINTLNNVFLCLIFSLSAASGILLIYGYKFQSFDLKFWHVITSLILLFGIIFHIMTHLNVWRSYFKKIFRAAS